MILEGLIDRRILVNVRLQPDVAARVLPAPFRPQIVQGWAVAGVCLIRLKNVRPEGWPAHFGIASENAAHRFAVEWNQHGEAQRGVYIPRRDTGSRGNAWAGGRLFPGLHHHSRFVVYEQGDAYRIAVQEPSGDRPLVEIAAERTTQHCSQLFPSLEAATEFFRMGSVGYSQSAQPLSYDGLQLRCETWSLQPLRVSQFQSSFFGDELTFPAGSVELDAAYLMERVPHYWHPLPALSAELPAKDASRQQRSQRRPKVLHAS
jgi:hypothetical protein